MLGQDKRSYKTEHKTRQDEEKQMRERAERQKAKEVESGFSGEMKDSLKRHEKPNRERRVRLGETGRDWEKRVLLGLDQTGEALSSPRVHRAGRPSMQQEEEDTTRCPDLCFVQTSNQDQLRDTRTTE